METHILQPPPSVEARIVEVLRQGDPLVLITLVASSGSTPRHAGTRALLTRQGFEGTVGGGILEAQTQQLAQRCLAEGRSQRQTFRLDSSSPETDMICGGSIDVVCEILRPSALDIFASALNALVAGKQGLWLLTIPPDADVLRRLVLEGHADWEHAQMLYRQTGGSGLIGDIYVEKLLSSPVLLLCGGGHVSLEVARLAAACDFTVDVVDDRKDFANPERFPMARHCFVQPGFQDLCSACGVVPGQYVAILTRGHAYDQEVLEQVLRSQLFFYIGMIGSRTKKEHVFANLRAKGFSKETLSGVCCPIGLGIKVETPQQIAVAIVGELLAAKGGVLPSLRPSR